MPDPKPRRGDRPAFPVTPTDNGGQIGPTMPGMTLREWLAGQALAGIMTLNMPPEPDLIQIAKRAVAMADAVLEALDE